MTSAEDLELLGEFRNETRELLADTDAAFLHLEKAPDDQDSINKIFRAFHTVKGNSSYFGLVRVKEFAHGVETCLDELRKGALVATSDLIDALLAAKDHLARLVEYSEDLSQVPAERDGTLLGVLQASRNSKGDVLSVARGLLAEIVGTVRDHATELPGLPTLLSRCERLLGSTDAAAARPAAKSPEVAVEAQKSGAEEGRDKEKNASRSMRIDESRIDGFFASVGDLINFAEIYHNMQRNLDDNGDAASTLREWKGTNRNFRILVDRMQRQVAEIRQVPVQGMLNKIARLARDTARSVDKQVAVELFGAEQLIDKSYVEVLESPLMHLVRNAIDHGLETPADRTANGKPAGGVLSLRFAVHKDHYELKVQDDGRGIDSVKVKAKALSKGLLTPSEAAMMSDEDAVNLVFRAGFSTAEKVSDLSGRGVGLDVVMDAVSQRKGAVRLTTEVGKGTTFHLSLPRTANLMVLESLLVQVGGMPYLIPLESLRETLDLSSTMITSLPEGGDVINVRDQVLPYVDLGTILGRKSAGRSAQAVVVQDRRRQFSLGVDKAMGLQKVAVKPLEDPMVERPYLRGAAILGNGSVGLVLNVSHFAR